MFTPLKIFCGGAVFSGVQLLAFAGVVNPSFRGAIWVFAALVLSLVMVTLVSATVRSQGYYERSILLSAAVPPLSILVGVSIPVFLGIVAGTSP
jgi:hypothetical protein